MQLDEPIQFYLQYDFSFIVCFKESQRYRVKLIFTQYCEVHFSIQSQFTTTPILTPELPINGLCAKPYV